MTPNRILQSRLAASPLLPAFLLAFATALPCAALNLNGYWVVRTPAAAGVARETFFRFAEQTGTITGNAAFTFGDFTIQNGTADKDGFKFSVAYGPGVQEDFTGVYSEEKFHLTSVFKGAAADWGMAEPTTAAAMAPPQRLPLPALRDLPNNGLAKTPPMGWNSWNHFRDKVDDATIREIADALVKTGMRDAGYKYVNIDDTWQGTRDAKGNLQPNAKFPNMKALADYVHERGLKLGLYTSPGPKSCAGFEGSYGHEEQDAKTFAAWGVDFLKYDWCSATRIYRAEEARAVAQNMAEKLIATGRPIVYSLSLGPEATPWKWGTLSGANLWRTTNRIKDSWESISGIGFDQSDLAGSAEPGHWNDPDMLEIGNGGLTPEESKTHLSLWAMLAAPLLAGNDLRSMSPETLAMLTNPDVIAVDQDSLGRPAFRIAHLGTIEVWVRTLADGGTAIAWFNTGDTAKSVSTNWRDLGVTNGSSVRDVWKHVELKERPDDLVLQPRGVAMFRVKPKPSGP